MKRGIVALVILFASSLLVATVSFAATTGTSAVTLAATATAKVQVLDATVSLTPTATDYDNDYVEVTGASGLRVRLKTNSTTGCTLSIRCADASPQIALADLLVKTQTAPGAGGTSITTYTAVTAANQTLWSTGATTGSPWLTVTTDVRIQNIFGYPDAIGAGTTSYTDNLTYTVAAQ